MREVTKMSDDLMLATGRWLYLGSRKNAHTHKHTTFGTHMTVAYVFGTNQWRHRYFVWVMCALKSFQMKSGVFD